MPKPQSRQVVYFFAFLGIIALTLSLIFEICFSSHEVSNIFRLIGECVAYFFMIFFGFFYVRDKRNPIWTIIYAICVTVIVVLVFLRVF